MLIKALEAEKENKPKIMKGKGWYKQCVFSYNADSSEICSAQLLRYQILVVKCPLTSHYFQQIVLICVLIILHAIMKGCKEFSLNVFHYLFSHKSFQLLYALVVFF